MSVMERIGLSLIPRDFGQTSSAEAEVRVERSRNDASRCSPTVGEVAEWFKAHAWKMKNAFFPYFPSSGPKCLFVDNYFITNWLQPNSAGRTFPHADPFLGNQYQIAVSDLAGLVSHKAAANDR